MPNICYHLAMIRLFSLLCAAAFAAEPSPKQVLVSVDGTPVRRSDVNERLWARYGTQALNDVVDELLISKAAKAAGIQAPEAEIEERLNRIRSQFPDEAAFKARLSDSGTKFEDLKADIAAQLVREHLVIKAKGLKVTEAEMKSFFETNKERLASPDAVRLRHIVVASEKEANDFLVAIKAGADFAKLASEVSLEQSSKAKGGDLGFIAKGILTPEIDKLVFGLKLGQVGGPIKTPQGVHIFKVEEISKAKPARFEEIKESLGRAMLADKIAAAWPEYVGELRRTAKIVPGR
jgi:foldase protein PrsA